MKNDAEHQIQCEFIKLARMWMPKERIVYAVPNQGQAGGKKAAIWGAYFKKEGKLAGVPDVFIAWPRLGFNGLYIEFKLPNNELRGTKKTYLSTDQKEVIPALRGSGYCVAVCRDAVDAFELLKRYALGECADDVMQDHNWK
jgi:hypothetical protein